MRVYDPRAGAEFDFPDGTPDTEIANHFAQQAFVQEARQGNHIGALAQMMGNLQRVHQASTSTLPSLGAGDVRGLTPNQTQAVMGTVQQDNVERARRRQTALAQIDQNTQREKDRQQALKLVQARERTQQMQQKLAADVAKRQAELKAQEPIEVSNNASLVDPATGQEIYRNTPPADSQPKVLGDGAMLVDGQGNIIIENRKDYKPTSGGGASLKAPTTRQGPDGIEYQWDGTQGRWIPAPGIGAKADKPAGVDYQRARMIQSEADAVRRNLLLSGQADKVKDEAYVMGEAERRVNLLTGQQTQSSASTPAAASAGPPMQATGKELNRPLMRNLQSSLAEGQTATVTYKGREVTVVKRDGQIDLDLVEQRVQFTPESEQQLKEGLADGQKEWVDVEGETVLVEKRGDQIKVWK